MDFCLHISIIGLLSRKSSWSEERDDILKRTKGAEFRALEDIEIKRAFQDFVSKLEKDYKEEERLKRMELQDKIDTLSGGLKVFLEKLAFDGLLTWSCRWKNWIDRKELIENEIYQEIEMLVGNKVRKIDGEELYKNEKIESKYPESLTSTLGNSSRNVFELVSDDLKEKYKMDKRLIKDVLEIEEYVIKHDSALEEFVAILCSTGGVTVGKDVDTKSTDEDISLLIPDKEEREKEKSDKSGKRDISKLLRSMMALRPKNPEQVFREIHEDCVMKYEEEMKRQKRREEKYIMLLRDFYNRSDHVGFEWEEAKKDLCKYSEYEALVRNDRKRIFLEHMKELEQLMKLKNKSLHDSMTSSEGKNGKDDLETGEMLGSGKRSDSDHRRYDRSNDGKRCRDDRDIGRSDHSGRERVKEEGDERSREDDRGRDKDKHRGEKDAERLDSRKRDRADKESKEINVETEEGEENDDEGDKKSKKNRKEKSPKRDKRHKKVREMNSHSLHYRITSRFILCN